MQHINDSSTSENKTAVVIKALLNQDQRSADPLGEIISLAETAGVEVLGSMVQKLRRPNPATWIGEGKVGEAAELANELDVDFIITDNDLSPAQEHNIEKMTEKTVIDRSQLIMDIFSQRAQTHQAKLQVELAQLRYSLPRLKRLWTHLSRYEGGIGMRGPGEKQLETDKRLIQRRIQKMVRDLKHIERRNQVAIDNRSGEFVVALAGYTNAGKSTLLNALTKSSELVEDKLFATLDTRVRRWPLSDNRHVLLTDTVGFIKDLPHHLVASFEATLTETRNADIILHVVDASSPQVEEHIRTVNRVLQDLECSDKTTWMVLNKWDALTPDKIPEANNLGNIAPASEPREAIPSRLKAIEPSLTFQVSAAKGAGLDTLARAVLDHIQESDEELSFIIPHARGDVVAYLRENAHIEKLDYLEDGVHASCAISPARGARLRHIFPEGFTVEKD